MLIRHLIFLSWIICTSNAASAGKQYFVSLEGSDSWDGTSLENIPGTDTGPWSTLQHAVQQLRIIRPSSPGPEDRTTLNILAGTYYQASTLALSNFDSYLDIVAYDGGEVSISGGYPLNLAWHRQGDVLSGRFIGSCAEVFFGTHRLLPARGPNTEWGWNKNVAQEPYNTITDVLIETDTCQRDSQSFAQSCPEEDRNGFIFTDELSADWEFLDQTEILIFHSWIAEYAKVANISEENGRKKVMFQKPLSHAPVGNYVKSSGWRFLIFNNLALLDVPGEYVCVEDKGEVQFSFIPPDGVEEEKPILSNLETILKVDSARNINIRGVKFQHTSSGGQDGYNWGAQAALKILNSEDVIIEDSQFSHTGMIGLYVRNSRRVTVQNNVFFDIGLHGIMLMFRNEDNILEDVMIRNNLFDGCGNSHFWQPGCLWVEGTNNISVVNNEIRNTPYMGIAVTGLMLHGDKYWSDNGVSEPTRADYVFHIEFNHIHDYGNGILSDFGGVYMGTDCDGKTEEELRQHCYTYIHVYNNLVDYAKAFNNDANFLYSDTSSCRNTFENNILYGSGHSPFYHHCGLDNVAKNNIVHRTESFAPLENIWGGCEKNSMNNLQKYSNFNNIYLLENAEGLTFGRPWDRFYNEAPDFHHNLYWSVTPGDKNCAMFPDDLTWDQWVLAGNDSSSVWADPLFLDPAAGQYILDQSSPAWDLGTEQIRLDNFGIQNMLRYKLDN